MFLTRIIKQYGMYGVLLSCIIWRRHDVNNVRSNNPFNFRINKKK